MDLDHDTCYRVISTRDARFDGRVFFGVRTTGIYCRPICPARTPRSANVSFYATAAAAQEAGFRPCLRCRPESAPDLAAWRGTSNTVNRALALIAEGGLDRETVGQLAEHLGVGERQLRRLFKQHLGASPITVSQTRRVFFARQLLAETRLPLLEVALAAGFGSVRRFNATFQALNRRPPSEMRRNAVAALDDGLRPAISLMLPYAPPYDWEAQIRFLAARAIPGVEHLDDSGRYHRSISLGGEQGSIMVALDGAAHALRATIRFPRITALATIVERIRRIFDLSADPCAIGAHLATDPLLAPLIAARPGLRVPGTWDGFELAVRGVLGHRITVATATRLAGRLVSNYGAPLERGIAEGLTHIFPRPDQLKDADLASLGIPRARAATLSALAKAAASDPHLFGPRQTLDEGLHQLRLLPGIGDWAAQYIAMCALREPDAFPATDVGLLRAAADWDGRRPTPAELLRRAVAWRPWRAYAALHLWASTTRLPPARSRTRRRKAKSALRASAAARTASPQHD
jgi:AraC family transcriptional regulator of adaptative response / DNA-3-methyladenine glycosylase II